MKNVRALGEIVRSIVGLLGFVPAESLVLVLGRAGMTVAVLRVSLADALQDGVGRVGELVGRQGIDSAVAVVVSDGVGRGGRLRELAGELAAELAGYGCCVAASVMVGQLKAGARWSCVEDPGVCGVLEDPATSTVAVAAVVSGQRMYASRAEMAATVEADPERVAQMAALLTRGEVVDVSTAVEASVRAIRGLAVGEVATDEELAVVASSLDDVRVRDALLAVDSDGAAEVLWAMLARIVPNPYRAEALVLLACAAYLRGEGPTAGVVLDALLSETPEHRLAGLLDIALREGLPPDAVRNVIAGAVPPLSV